MESQHSSARLAPIAPVSATLSCQEPGRTSLRWLSNTDRLREDKDVPVSVRISVIICHHSGQIGQTRQQILPPSFTRPGPTQNTTRITDTPSWVERKIGSTHRPQAVGPGCDGCGGHLDVLWLVVSALFD
jgi:hypothetical protein